MDLLKGIRNIVFDMGGVLIDLDRDACIREFAKMGYHEADRLLDPYLQSGIFLGLEKGEVTPGELYSYIQGRCPGATPSAIDNALFAFLTGFPQEKLDMLLRLRKDYNIYMLSNTNSIMFDYIVDRWFCCDGRSTDDYFDRLFLSYKMGVVKPSPEIFRMMLSEASMEPCETLFIDDAPANVETASKLGIRTYLAAPKEKLEQLLG